MINRKNKHIMDLYVQYREKFDQLSPKSLRLIRTWLLHFLTWADETPFKDCLHKEPTFASYLLSPQARRDGKGQGFSKNYIRKIFEEVKRFLVWYYDEFEN